MGLDWTKRPTELDIARYVRELEAGARQLARESALGMEAEAKVNAPWQDDSGKARAGLQGVTEDDPNGVLIVLTHSMEYGLYLELARGGKYAILWPTIEAELPRLKAALDRLVQG